MDPKKDILADLNLASLMQSRAEAVEKHKQAAARVETAKAGHFLRFWLGGGAMALAALWIAEALPEYSPFGMFVLSACIIFWLGMWIAAFFSAGAVRRLQDEAGAAKWQITQIDDRIAFCHQVLDEANRARVRKYAQAMIEKETS